MRLWTIQTEAAWSELDKRGSLRCRRIDADRDMLPAYDWMASQMKLRIGGGIASLPLWAWLQYDGEDRKRPDLRSSGHLPRGTRGYRVEIEMGDDEVLLSDYELWHYVLNYWYLGCSEFDANKFDLRHNSPVFSWTHPPCSKQLDRTIRRSWERIFDVDWFDLALRKLGKGE